MRGSHPSAATPAPPVACSTDSESCSGRSPRSADTRCVYRTGRRAFSSSDFRACGGRIDPLPRAIHVLLALPNRHAALELLDHESRRVVCLRAMWVSDSNDDARLPQTELADAMLDDNVIGPEARSRLVHDRFELARGHGLICGVLDAAHGAAV